MVAGDPLGQHALLDSLRHLLLSLALIVRLTWLKRYVREWDDIVYTLWNPLTSSQVKNASITVPRMMLGTTMINGVLGLVTIITYVLVIQDVEEQILGAGNAYPWIGVFEVATGSKAGAVVMTIPFIIIGFGRLRV
jgi:hypothetical protein